MTWMTQSTTAAGVDSWIAFRGRGPEPRLRLFCFPYAGAGALIYRTWTEALPSDVEVCPVQLPGRGARSMELPFTRLSPLLDALTPALAPLLNKPFALFGHSLGALVSFELARRTRRDYGVSPVRLFVSAGRAPQIPKRGSLIHSLPRDEFLSELRRLNGMPAELLDHHEFMKIMLPILRADFAVYETYEYSSEPPLDCPISAFGGLQDRRVSNADLEGWQVQTKAPFSLQMFPGDHFFLKDPLLLRTLSQELQ
ncbi:MAG: alpha/beta fold hydrolase [Candidatus Binataceae bacterium]